LKGYLKGKKERLERNRKLRKSYIITHASELNKLLKKKQEVNEVRQIRISPYVFVFYKLCLTQPIKIEKDIFSASLQIMMKISSLELAAKFLFEQFEKRLIFLKCVQIKKNNCTFYDLVTFSSQLDSLYVVLRMKWLNFFFIFRRFLKHNINKLNSYNVNNKSII
jgi:hypothetical protein